MASVMHLGQDLDHLSRLKVGSNTDLEGGAEI